MKSIELGDYDVFSGLLSLFTAVIGLAYPFILQAIERIQERYVTEKVSHWFEEETTFARFFFMLKANIPIAFLAPFFLFLFHDCVLLSITVMAVQSVLVCLLLFYLMGLYKQVDTYSSYIKMAEYSSKEDMERVAIVMLSADHNEEKEGYDAAHDKLYGRIAELLVQEAQKRNGNLVEFPAEVLQVARQILLAAEKREVYPRISCDTTLIPLLYDTIYNKSHPTKELRSFIWFHLNRLLKAGNTDWLKSYWEWASQYYRTMRYNGSYDEFERNEFHEMHLFFAAMVLRSGNKELMEHIMSFQDTLPDPPPLLLYRTNEIIQTLLDFDKLRNWPFRLVKPYQMYFFANDVNADHNIFRVLCDYLAFSLLNIINKQDCNSYTINEYLIDEKISIERLKKERETLEWFRSTVMINISKTNRKYFSSVQAEAARTLLLELVEKYDKRIEAIKEHDNIDPSKLDALKKEIIVECERMALPLQRKKMDGEDVEQLKFIVPVTAQAAPGQLLEHYNTSSVNFTEVLVAYLRHQFYARFASLFILNGPVATYLIQYKDLGEALRRMYFNKDEYVLLNNGISFLGQDLGYIKHEEIIAIGSGNNSLFIIKKDDCPTYSYGTLADMHQIDKQYVAIDESKGLFWKEPTDNLIVHIAQPYILYNRRHMRFLKINITYDRALGDCSLHKLKDISEIL